MSKVVFGIDDSGEVWISPEAWKARMLNQLFEKHGVTHQRGNIKPETVRHERIIIPTEIVDSTGDKDDRRNSG